MSNWLTYSYLMKHVSLNTPSDKRYMNVHNSVTDIDIIYTCDLSYMWRGILFFHLRWHIWTAVILKVNWGRLCSSKFPIRQVSEPRISIHYLFFSRRCPQVCHTMSYPNNVNLFCRNVQRNLEHLHVRWILDLLMKMAFTLKAEIH